MKRMILYTLLVFVAIGFSACDDWLDREPKTFIDDEKAYSGKENITAIITNLYNRLPDTGAMYQGTGYFTELDEAMSGVGQNDLKGYANGYLEYYDYTLMRDINTHLSKLKNVTVLSEDEKSYYIAEARFIRAYVYFEMVKRMGGVPLITDVMVYDPSKDITTYEVPRSKEYEIYDFIASELDEILDDLNLPAIIQYNRASKGAALALKCRAMLYAGSLAKYNSLMEEPVSLPGQEVGIPVSMSVKYYQASLQAAKDLMDMGIYGLYDKDADKKTNFYKLFTTLPNAGNNESIFIKEYLAPTILHSWTASNLPRSFTGGGTSGTAVNPSLNLVDAFKNLDGTDGKLQAYVDPDHADETSTTTNKFDNNPESYLYYDNIEDIFRNKDNRLFATVMLPGSTFMNKALDIRAGIAYYNEKSKKLVFYEQGNKLDNPNDLTIDGVLITEAKTGYDGPSEADYITRTGFYVRKYMDEKTESDGGSAVSFIRYRYGEVLLNAAEAAYELGGAENESFALDCINQLRERAGFTKLLESLTIDDIRAERQVELAFEGHRFYDLRRWRIAEDIWNGNNQSKTAMLYGLWPYKVYRPGHETHNKWIFIRRLPAKFPTPRKFNRVSYYSAFNADVLTKNSKLVKNPGH